MTDYIIDTNVLSYYVWGKIIKADEIKKGKILMLCSKTSDKPYALYTCQIKHNNNTIGEVDLAEGELESLKHTADSYRKIGEESYEIHFNENTVEKLKNTISKVKNVCSTNNCYVPPEIPIAFKDGNIKDLFRQSIRGRIVFAPYEREFNKHLREFFRETKAKVLVDSDLINKIDPRYRNLLVDNIKRTIGDEYIYKDEKNEFYPIIKITDGKNTITYDTKHKILNINGRMVKVDNETLERHPALRKIVDVLEQSPYDVNKIHEALKTLHYAKIKDFKIEKLKEFEPEKAYVDSYLASVAHGNVKIITADMGLKEGFTSSVTPLSKENIEVIK